MNRDPNVRTISKNHRPLGRMVVDREKASGLRRIRQAVVTPPPSPRVPVPRLPRCPHGYVVTCYLCEQVYLPRRGRQGTKKYLGGSWA